MTEVSVETCFVNLKVLSFSLKCQEMQLIRCIANLAVMFKLNAIKCPVKSKRKPLFVTKVLRLFLG